MKLARTLLIAQGDGFYGFALAQIDLSKEEVMKRLSDAKIRNVLPVDNPGITVPYPMVILDSGNAAQDKQMLEQALLLLA